MKSNWVIAVKFEPHNGTCQPTNWYENTTVQLRDQKNKSSRSISKKKKVPSLSTDNSTKNQSSSSAEARWLSISIPFGHFAGGPRDRGSTIWFSNKVTIVCSPKKVTVLTCGIQNMCVTVLQNDSQISRAVFRSLGLQLFSLFPAVQWSGHCWQLDIRTDALGRNVAARRASVCTELQWLNTK